MVGLMQRLWFEDKGLRLAMRPGQIFFPADLVVLASNQVSPEELMFDCAGAERFTDGELDAAIFPPMRLHHWDQLRMTSACELDFDAGVSDPRFRARSASSISLRSSCRRVRTRRERDRLKGQETDQHLARQRLADDLGHLLARHWLDRRTNGCASQARTAARPVGDTSEDSPSGWKGIPMRRTGQMPDAWSGQM
jgi:hypothetical protein